MSNPRLSKDLIIICLNDFIVYGTGVTFLYYRGAKYKITEYLPVWFEKDGTHAWKIKLIEGEGDPIGFFLKMIFSKNLMLTYI